MAAASPVAAAEAVAAPQETPAVTTQDQQQAEQPTSTAAVGDAEDEDADETCGFCRFMKGGGCRSAFTVGRTEGRGAAAALSCFSVACHPAAPVYLGVLVACSSAFPCDPQPVAFSLDVAWALLQNWSECVDKERGSGGDFTEECREKVGAWEVDRWHCVTAVAAAPGAGNSAGTTSFVTVRATFHALHAAPLAQTNS